MKMKAPLGEGGVVGFASSFEACGRMYESKKTSRLPRLLLLAGALGSRNKPSVSPSKENLHRTHGRNNTGLKRRYVVI